ncbi:hypothetical protein DV495_001656 [Geotrichum candidum]|uniref:endo-polygalacturonase n=1 Tax=Geotrichum candidum TaxID=1173061 RepID=A0A0J9XC79_GEOCN|nr:hypothetical protein DV452_002285 [Geotrichum candidum]KAI9214318.1 hypothetical protein DS838_000838 [Geotrichum bryndzae]KAF5118755.1 hypothetical protein DV454_000362 [Geotrichum candidum]KAF5132057.1 hypothetical protein DV495_001656 [Geotrichum candidum]KAF7501637.1 hypothetical protein DV113_000368 [Geotrichum candidum]
MHISNLLSVASLAALAAAAPSELERRQQNCVITDFNKIAGLSKYCDVIALRNIHVPAGQSLDLTNLKEGAHIIFEGRTTFGYAEWDGPLIKVSGKHITVRQSSGSVLDGEGERWWDYHGGNGGKTKPHFFSAHNLDDSRIEGLKVKNTPVHGFSLDSKNLVVSGVTIDNSDGDNKGAYNTDAFDVAHSYNLTIENAWVHNQDDCLAINQGDNIRFINGYCYGSHGLSIGSVGNGDVVSNVEITDSQIVNSQNGVRIKTKSGQAGEVRNITFRNISLTNITDYGLIVQQDYNNPGHATNGIKIHDITFDNIHGTALQKGYNIALYCGDGSCYNWSWKNVKIHGARDYKCQNYPSVASCSAA